MFNTIKNLIPFAKKSDDDNIPEVHLQKNEPKVRYDPVRKRYIFGDEEPEEEKPKGPPPKLKPSTLSKSKSTKKFTSSSRYANVLGEENIIQTTPEVPKEEIVKEEPIKEEEEKTPEKAKTNEDILQTLTSNTNEKENKLDEQKNDDVISEIEHKEEEASTIFNHEINTLQNANVNQNNGMINTEAHEAEIEKIKDEFKEQLEKKENELLNEIAELKESLQFEKDNFEENTQLLKDQINKFINENLTLKANFEKSEDELKNKSKEIEGLNKIIEHYRSYIDDKKRDSDSNANIESTANEKGNDLLIINSKLERLESEKLILSNDIIELKGENETIKIENKFLSNKSYQLENQNEQYKKDISKLEKKIVDQSADVKSLISKKDDLEHQIKKRDQSIKSFNDKIAEQNETISTLHQHIKNTNEKIQNITQDKNTLKEELKQTKIQYDTKLIQKQKEIDDITAKTSQYKKEKQNEINVLIKKHQSLDKKYKESLISNGNTSEYEKMFNDSVQKINSLKEDNFTNELILDNYTNSFKRIISFLNSNKEHFSDEINKIIPSSYIDTNFDSVLCSIIMSLISSNEIAMNDNSALKTQNEILTNEISNLQNEVMVSAAKVKFTTSDYESEKRRNAKKTKELMKSYEKEISKLREQMKTFNIIKEENHELANKLSTLNDLKNENSQLKEQVKDNERLERENTQLKEKINELMLMILKTKNEFEAEMQSTKKSYEDIQIKFSSLEETLSHTKQNYESQLEESSNNNKALQSKVSSLESEKEIHSKQLIDVQNEKNQLAEKIKELMGILTTMEEDAEKENEEKEQSNQEMINKLTEKENEINQLHSQLMQKDSSIEMYQKEKLNISSQLSQELKEKKQLQEDLLQLQKNYDIVNDGLKNSQISIDNLCKEKNEAIEKNMNVINSLQKEKNDYENKIKEMMELLQQNEKDMVDNETNTDPIEIKLAQPIEEKRKEEKPMIKEEKKENVKIEETPSQQNNSQQDPKANLGFFGRILAPIFLTEDDIVKIQGNTTNI